MTPGATPAARASRYAARARPFGPPLLFACLLAVPLALWLAGAGYLLSFCTRVLALALAAMSLDLLIGVAGLVSFGHAAFLGIGVYAVGILSSFGVQDGFAQMLAAMGAAAVFGAVTGAVAIRTRGVYFIMITLAFGQMLYFVATALAQFGGDDGMPLVTRSRFFGAGLLDSDTGLYYAAFSTLLAGYLLLRRIVSSRFGRVLAGARENEVRMESVGFRPFPFRVSAYVLSGVITSVAGCLLANQTGFVSPAAMAWQRSGDLIFMVVLGGLGSLHGAILGAVVFLIGEEVLSGWTEHWGIVFGPLLVLAVLFARGGLAGTLAGAGRQT